MPESAEGILPDFIVIGAMKAGTTTLYEYLARHPEIGVSRQKETDFFVREKNWSRGLDWYRRQFDGGARVYGEVSPNYSKAGLFAGVPQRIAALQPECRFIFLARDPVARALSQYRHAWNTQQRNLPPPDALVGTKAWKDLVDPSLYHRQALEFLKIAPPGRLLVLDFEAFARNPGPSLSRVARFVGVTDEWPPLERSAFNTSADLAGLPRWYWEKREGGAIGALRRALPHPVRQHLRHLIRLMPARPAPELGDGVRERLAEEVAEDAARFRELTGQAFPSWSV